MNDSEILEKIREVFRQHDCGDNIIRDTGLVRSRKECEQALKMLETKMPSAYADGKIQALKWFLCEQDEL